jgi:hypothetical protein
MLRHVTVLACILLLMVAPPAVASPRSDAEFIAALLVRTDAYRNMLHDRLTNARMNRVRARLSEHSTKVADQDKLAELLSDFEVPEPVVERIEQIVADKLLETMTPERLALLADHLRADPDDRDARSGGARPNDAERAMTIDEFREKVEELQRLTEAPAFAREMEMFSIGVMLISLAVQASVSVNADPSPSELAELLEVDGVFTFPNRIARRDLIRDLRAADP